MTDSKAFPCVHELGMCMELAGMGSDWSIACRSFWDYTKVDCSSRGAVSQNDLQVNVTAGLA